MLLSSLLRSIALASAASMQMKIYYDELYDNKTSSMNLLACSDGSNGLVTKHGWTTQEQIPDFPFIGGSSFVQGWNSTHCGECYAVSWRGHKTYMTAVDSADDGLVMSKQGMDSLTAHQAEFLGSVDAEIEVVHAHWCAMPT